MSLPQIITDHPTVSSVALTHGLHLAWGKVKAAAAWLRDNDGWEGLWKTLRFGKPKPTPQTA